MRRILAVAVAGLLVVGLQNQSSAATYAVELSPEASRALNLGTQVYPGDHAPGLSPLNEGAKPSSTATGGILGGITYNDDTNVLTFDFGYGSAFGFSDLTSNWNGGVHIHGNGTNTALFPSNNSNAGVIIDLGPAHTASGTRSGRVTGTTTLSATHETWLKDNQLYINVHSVNLPAGELRGQLVIVPEPAAGLLAMALLPLLARRRRT